MFIVYGGLVSAFFILLVLVVYGLLEKLRSNLHGMMLMVFMASLMAFWVFQSGTLIYEYKLLSEGFFITEASEVCKWICPITYFFILSTFFWMNVMCFDIWWTFRGTRKVREIHRRGIKAKFLTYSLYAFGLPCLVTIAAVAIDMSDTPISVSKPGFATCLHDSEDLKAKLYRFLPMMFLVTGNVILYTLTIYNIWAVKRHMAGVESTQVKKNKNQFIVYLKLSVIMGVSWIIELILTLIEEDSFPTWLFYLLNCFNIFSGVLIFFILVFKWSIFVMLYRRFGFENRWTRKISQVQASTRTDCDAKSTKSYAKTKSTDDSIVFESMALSHADTTKNNYSRISTSRV